MAGEVIRFNITKLRIGGFNATTGAIVDPVEIKVIKNTLDLVESDETTTPIYVYGKKSPAKTLRSGDNIEEVTFNVADTSAKSLAFWLGGTTTTVDLVDTYHKPKGNVPEKIVYLEATMDDGSIMLIPRGTSVAKKDFKGRDNDVFFLVVKITPTDTGIPLISDFSISDPVAA